MIENVDDQNLDKLPLNFDNTEIAFREKNDGQLKDLYQLYKLINNTILFKIAPAFMRFFLSLKDKVIDSQFYGGTSLEACESVIQELGRGKVNAILNYSAKKVQNKADYISYSEEIIRAINYASTEERVSFVMFKVSALASFKLLEKMSAKRDLSSAEETEYFKVKGRINSICKTAFDLDIQVIIDAEDQCIQYAVDVLAIETMQLFNLEKAVVYNTYSFYERSDSSVLKEHYLQAEMYGFILGAHVIENEIAKYKEDSTVIMPEQENYPEAVGFCVTHIKYIALIATMHNAGSCINFINVLSNTSVPANHPHVYFSQLLGLNDDLSFNLAHAGFNVAKNITYGDFKGELPSLLTIQKKNMDIEVPMERALKLIITERGRRRNL